jgi:hypothetical protein
MYKHQVPLSQRAPDDPDPDPDHDFARHLFGDEVREPPILNAELGIFPIEEDE